jgi:DNA-binding transcriptional LysR family regulator
MGDAVSPVEHFGTISVSAWEPIIHAHSPWRPRRLRPISGIGQLRARRAAAERHASAVGKSVARLEKRLGVRLFVRTTRRQSLTEDGQAYYERCVRAMQEIEAGEDVLASSQRAPTGRLRISVPVLFGRHCVAPVLLRLANRYPNLTIETSFSDRVVDMVQEGYDLAVRIGELPDSASYAARKLGVQRMSICAAPAYVKEHGLPTSVDDLEHHTAIVYGNGTYATWRVRDNEGRIRELQPASRLRFDDLQSIADAAAAGGGLAWLPCWLIGREVRAGNLTLVMDSQRVLATDIHVVWPRSRYLPYKTRTAIDALVVEIAPLIDHHGTAQAAAIFEGERGGARAG